MADFQGAMLDLDHGATELLECRDSGDDEELQAILTRLDLLMLLESSWPESFFIVTKVLQEDVRFLKLKNSWYLLRLIGGNWSGLSAEQRVRLRGAIVWAFDKFRDPLGAFVAAEILGEHYPDAETLRMLVDLGKSATWPAQGYVPHGIEWLAKACDDPEVRRMAIEKLRTFSESDKDELRLEAFISLRALGEKG